MNEERDNLNKQILAIAKNRVTNLRDKIAECHKLIMHTKAITDALYSECSYAERDLGVIQKLIEKDNEPTTRPSSPKN